VLAVRRTLSESEAKAHDLFSNFRELHSQGELSDEEYRTIKATLAARLQREIKGKDKEG
jgi:metal-dependent amidase/aminoacylase/carboxypeptidase family protein